MDQSINVNKVRPLVFLESLYSLPHLTILRGYIIFFSLKRGRAKSEDHLPTALDRDGGAE